MHDPEVFALELEAIKLVREKKGLKNLWIMLPFVRTVQELIAVKKLISQAGLFRSATFKIWMMVEIPSNVILADQFLDLFDGMSIGSNDLTQLVLGLDRDSGIVSHVSNENNPAVRALVSQIIKKCKEKGKYIGICGQAPSDHVDFATFLVEEGIESMSLNPDTVVSTTLAVAETEQKHS
jgi:pyruvate,water dikinase